jgi:hypothetical protein
MSCCVASKQIEKTIPGSSTVARKYARHRFDRPSLVTMCLLAFAALAPTEALAQCAPGGGNNVTVTCSGATLNQGPEANTGYGSGLQSGLTLTVQSGASVTGTSTGIDVGNNNTITNLGTVTTKGSGGIGDVFGINSNGANLTVINSGTIGRLDIPNFIFDLAGINASDTGLSVTNKLGATIQGTFGIQGVGTGTVTNSGLITGLTGGGGGEGIDFAANNTSMVTVTNNATGVINGDANGINANSAIVFNHGTISAPTTGGGGTGINANTLVLTNFQGGLVTGDSFGVSGSQTPNLTITNFGTISATGLGGIAIQGNVVNVTNSGTVSALSGGGSLNAISMTSGSVTNNAGGLITSDSIAIGSSGNTSVFNAGTINGGGGTAISFASGGNTLTLAPGSVINGTAHGFGADTFQLGGTTGNRHARRRPVCYAIFRLFDLQQDRRVDLDADRHQCDGDALDRQWRHPRCERHARQREHDRQRRRHARRHRHRRQHHGREWRHVASRQWHAGFVPFGHRQSRLPVRRALPGPAQPGDIDIHQGQRHRDTERSCGSVIRVRQLRLEAIYHPDRGGRR